MFGLVTLLAAMPVLYFTVGQGTGNAFDVLAALEQIFQRPELWATSMCFAVSIGAFNYFGLNITRYISATSRTTIDTSRTLFIWIISLALGWESFLWLQVAGFLVLIYGTFLFNQVIGVNPFAGAYRCCRRSRPTAFDNKAVNVVVVNNANGDGDHPSSSSLTT